MLPRRAAAAALAVAAAASGWLLLTSLGGSEDDPAPAAARGGATAAVTRQTLVERETVEGTLGYADSRPVINRLGSAGGGGGSPANEFASYTPDQEPSETTPQRTTPDETAPEPNRSSPEPSPRGQSPDSPGDDPSGGGGTGSGEGPASGEAPGSGEGPPRGDAPGSGDTPSRGGGSRPAEGPPAGDGDGSGGSPSRGDGTGSGGAPSGSDSGSADPVTLTSTASPGSVVGRGGVLYRVDGEPVILLYGSTPAYRDLSAGAEGRDVLQLERNLAALGFAPGTVDEAFTSDTAAAVSRWQEANDLPETGTVELGRVVFLPGERRIGAREATVGAPLAAGTEVM
jgi:Putative peptidoglycan binding domain